MPEICGNELDDDCDGAVDPASLCTDQTVGGGCGADQAGRDGSPLGLLVLLGLLMGTLRRRQI
jgi:MYXO-CTERM domain-containing protein